MFLGRHDRTRLAGGAKYSFAVDGLDRGHVEDASTHSFVRQCVRRPHRGIDEDAAGDDGDVGTRAQLGRPPSSKR